MVNGYFSPICWDYTLEGVLCHKIQETLTTMKRWFQINDSTSLISYTNQNDLSSVSHVQIMKCYKLVDFTFYQKYLYNGFVLNNQFSGTTYETIVIAEHGNLASQIIL